MIVYLSGGPVPHPLRVTAMQAPYETGYAYSIANTWYRSEFNPHTAPIEAIRSKNTGYLSPPWEIGGPVISDGFVVQASMPMNRVSGGVGPVEIGAEFDSSVAGFVSQGGDAWCCSLFNPFCGPEDCAIEDMEAAQSVVEDLGGGVVAAPDTALIELDALQVDEVPKKSTAKNKADQPTKGVETNVVHYLNKPPPIQPTTPATLELQTPRNLAYMAAFAGLVVAAGAGLYYWSR